MTHETTLNNCYTDDELARSLIIMKEAMKKCNLENLSPFATTHAIAILERSNEMSAKDKIGDAIYEAFWDMCKEDAVRLYRSLGKS